MKDLLWDVSPKLKVATYYTNCTVVALKWVHMVCMVIFRCSVQCGGLHPTALTQTHYKSEELGDFPQGIRC
jgi:hypothetical protein